MDNQLNSSPTEVSETPELHDRRELVRKLGRFATYAAPFTLLVLTKKASAISSSGPGPHSKSAGSAHR